MSRDGGAARGELSDAAGVRPDLPLQVTIVAHDIRAAGGMEMQLTTLIEGCLARGLAVTVVARVCEIPPRAGLTFVRVPGPARPFVIAYPWFAAAAGLLLRRHRRGVLHLTGAIVPNRADIGTLHYCHHAVSSEFSLQRGTRATPLYALNARVGTRMAIAGERYSYRRRRLRRLVTLSASGTREAQSHFPELAASTMIIPHGVDRATFAPDPAARTAVRAELGLGEHELLALFVGGDWPRKGLTEAIDALPLAPGWRLLVAGSGDRASFQARADKLGVGERVLFLEFVERPAPLFAAADVFVLPTAYETFSLVTHEAAAAGLPLLAGRVNGIEDLIEPGVNGWFVERHGADIAARLRKLGADGDLRRRMGRAARAASERYSWDEAVDAYVELYRELSAPESAHNLRPRSGPLRRRGPRSVTRLACLATQGARSRDGVRIQSLLAPLQPAVFEFEHGRTARSALSVMGRVLRDRPDVVVMEGTGVGGGLPLIAARALVGTRYVVSSGDAVGPFMAGRARILALPFGIYERVLYRMSAGVIGWTPYLAGRALTFGAPRAMTAAGWAPDAPADDAHRTMRDEARAQLGIPADALVFGLVGSLAWNRRYGYAYGLEMIRALRASTRTDLRVLIVGDGPGRSQLGTAGAGDPRLLLPGRVPREQVPAMLAAMDVASLPQSVDSVGSFRYTTKLSEYLAAGLPVVTGQIPLAYDLDDGWLWRLPGTLPWEETYCEALVALMDGLTREELDRRRDQVPRALELFDEARQRERVTTFVRDIAAAQR